MDCLSWNNLLAKDGYCKTFDNSCDGYVRSEGGGMLLLERSDTDSPIHAIIKGSSVQEDGRSSTLTAPNGSAQEQLLQTTLQEAGLVPSDINVIEAHGTGTPLGDPIELHALDRVYTGTGLQELNAKHNYDPLYVTGVKSNIGHLETAAGIAGIIKGIMMIENRQVAPVCHFKKLNNNIKLQDQTRIAIAHELMPLDVDTIRVGISSFGFSGIISHLILEEHDDIPENNRKVAHWIMTRVIHPSLIQESHNVSDIVPETTHNLTALTTNDIVCSPLLGFRQMRTDSRIIYKNYFNESIPAFMKDHVLLDTIIVPAAAYVSMALNALNIEFDCKSMREK